MAGMEIYEFGKDDSQFILLQPVDGHDLSLIESEIALIREGIEEEFKLIAFKVAEWNRDLSPWKAPAVFGSEGFGGEAQNTLEEILGYCKDQTKTYIIGGYSLAGLFALWAAHNTDRFAAVAAVSPSVWFPGFDAYMKENEIRCNNVYLSLGDKEEKARNPVMATVGDRIRFAGTLLKESGVNTILEWNPGNHFKDFDIRTAKGFIWTINNRQ